MNNNLVSPDLTAGPAPELSALEPAALEPSAQADRLLAEITEGPLGPGLIFKGRSIHNVQDPWAEAAGWLAQAPRYFSDLPPGLAAVFGLGLGYHLKILRRNYPGIRLLVYEPAPEMAEIWYLRSPWRTEDGEPPFVFTSPEEFKAAVSREVVYGPPRGLIAASAAGVRELDPEGGEAFELFIRQEVARRAVIDRTRERTGPAFMANLGVNAGRASELPDLMVLKGRLAARAAFLVGSGPSLAQNAEFLRGVGDRGLILAAGSAVKPLLAQGVSPDVIVVIESEDTSSYLMLTETEREIIKPGVILALASGSHPAHFTLSGFNMAVFHLSAGEASLFSQGVFLPQGGNAGTAAFALAYCWGLGPLILVGQDQAYAGGRLHADGTPGETPDQDGSPLFVPGVAGGLAATNTGLMASLGWYAEAARTIKAKAGPPELLNASAGGARIEGFQETDLKEAVAALPPVAGPLNLAEVLPKLPRASKKEVMADVKQMAGVVDALRRLAAIDYRKAYAEVKGVGQVSKFLARLLAEAQVAVDRREFLNSLDRAARVMTDMTLALK